MVSKIMKKAVANRLQPSQEAMPHRSALLAGIEHIDRWLRNEIAEANFQLSDRTAIDYLKKGARLKAARPRPGEPPDLNALTNSRDSFYAYRAAWRYDACIRGSAALRAYAKALKAKNPAAKQAAYAALLEAAADLKAYPRDKEPGLPNPALVKLGLADEKPRSAFTKDVAKKLPKRDTSKLKAANKIQKIDCWRHKLFVRLTEIRSPWRTFAAVAAITGVRPEELDGLIVERRDNALLFTIQGAKVGVDKGQEWRRLTAKDDGPEFAHLWSISAVPYTLKAPSLKNYRDAFSTALARAGAQVFPAGTPRMSAYVYRHALISDLKADGLSSQQISTVLGHAVTRTAAHYGRAISGIKGVRQVTAEGARKVKENHAFSATLHGDFSLS